MKLGYRAARGAAAIILCASAAAAATQADLPVLGRLQGGLWQLRNLDGGGGSFGSICLGDPGALAQLRHRAQSCSRSVVAHGADTVEVQYSCPAASGHTTIRVETSQLARVESQGIDNGVPFGFRAEARRVGPCR
jgi:hypothetical protein